MLVCKENEYECQVLQVSCDACGLSITSYFSGMVVYAEPESPGELCPHYHCHKADPCQRKTRMLAGHTDGRHGDWDELADFLVKLAAGIGLLPKDFTTRYEYLWQRDAVPDPIEAADSEGLE